MAENLLGQEHDHDFTVPFRGYLQCADDYCGSVRTTAGEPLTEEQREDIRRQLREEYG